MRLHVVLAAVVRQSMRIAGMQRNVLCCYTRFPIRLPWCNVRARTAHFCNRSRRALAANCATEVRAGALCSAHALAC